MTEEIIIDGVNVAGCNDFYKEQDNWSGKDNYRCQDYLSGMCAGNDCYYKQLKRLEQENKELKEEIRFHNKENSNLLAERNAAQIGYDEIREVRELYRSALEEIREIVSDEIDKTDSDDELMQIYGTIFNKINEVLSFK